EGARRVEARQRKVGGRRERALFDPGADGERRRRAIARVQPGREHVRRARATIEIAEHLSLCVALEDGAEEIPALGEVDVDDGASEAAVLVVAEAGDACLVRRELCRRADAMTSDDVVPARLEPDAIAAGDSIIDRRQPVAWIDTSPTPHTGPAP